MFWDQDIYIRLQSVNIHREVLIGFLLHEAAHCYYWHYTIIFIVIALRDFLFVTIGGWFILKSGFTDGLLNGLSSNKNQNEKPTKVSTAVKLLTLYLVVFPALVTTLVFAINLLRRHMEFSADSFAANLLVTRMGCREEFIRHYETATEKFHGHTKSKMYSLLYETHPWMSERIEELRKAVERSRKLQK